MNQWPAAQTWEKEWWGMCINTLSEEIKQLLYAEKMGLKFRSDEKTPYGIEMHGKSVLDIGGGPTSLLLRCVDVDGRVMDPLEWPEWVIDRYRLAGLKFASKRGEDLELDTSYDECWIYNCLQHVEIPKLVVRNAKLVGKIVRVFEWLEMGVVDGHPHNLTEEKLDIWLGGSGAVEILKGERGCWGKCYYGVFKGENYGNQEV